MGRFGGIGFREAARVAEENGWVLSRSKGSHAVYTKLGKPRPLTIPRHREIAEGTLRSIIRTMGLSVDEFLEMARK